MRNRTQVVTSEIDDSDLDSISGGTSISGGGAAGPLAASGGADVEGVEGLTSSAAAALPTMTAFGTVSS